MSYNSLEDRAMVMWNDESPEAIKLKNQLMDKGYRVKSIFTSSSRPILKDESGDLISGYDNIRWLYVAN